MKQRRLCLLALLFKRLRKTLIYKIAQRLNIVLRVEPFLGKLAECHPGAVGTRKKEPDAPRRNFRANNPPVSRHRLIFRRPQSTPEHRRFVMIPDFLLAVLAFVVRERIGLDLLGSTLPVGLVEVGPFHPTAIGAKLQLLIAVAVRAGNPVVHLRRAHLPALPDIPAASGWRSADDLPRSAFALCDRQAFLTFGQGIAARAREQRVFVGLFTEQESNRSRLRAGLGPSPDHKQRHRIKANPMLCVVAPLLRNVSADRRGVLNQRLDSFCSEVLSRFLIGHQDHCRARVDVNAVPHQVPIQVRPSDLSTFEADDLFDVLYEPVADVAPIRRPIERIGAGFVRFLGTEHAILLGPLRRRQPLLRVHRSPKGFRRNLDAAELQSVSSSSSARPASLIARSTPRIFASHFI